MEWMRIFSPKPYGVYNILYFSLYSAIPVFFSSHNHREYRRCSPQRATEKGISSFCRTPTLCLIPNTLYLLKGYFCCTFSTYKHL